MKSQRKRRQSPTRFRRIRNRRQSFTLIELLVSIGIIGILASVVIIAINPSQQLKKAQNIQRLHNVRSIIDAYEQYAIDHDGEHQDTTFPLQADCAIPVPPAPARKFCLSSVSATDCDFGTPIDGAGCVFTGDLAPLYLSEIPSDPKDDIGGDEDKQVDYAIRINIADKHIVISAPKTEIPPALDVLTVTR
ncbi:type II secretion system protein [Candidatus Peribacteria bacterium]|nr:type II secretion system protein [Candidatus Peribacteria bacterium]